MIIPYYLRIMLLLVLIQIALIGLAQGIGTLIGGEIVLVETRLDTAHGEFALFDPHRNLSTPTFLQRFAIRYAMMSLNGKVLFTTFEGQHYIADVMTGQLTAIVSELDVSTAQWSPDGTRLAATLINPVVVAVVNLDGSYIIVGADMEAPGDFLPSWSFSGDLILFLRSATEQMVIADPDTGDIIARREFTPFHTQTSGWIGEYVYYLDNRQNYRWHVRSNTTELLEDESIFSAPDGIHYLSMPPGESVSMGRTDSSERTPLTFLAGERITYRFSPDSTRVAFAAYSSASDLNRITIVELASAQPLYTFLLTGNGLLDAIRWQQDAALMNLNYPDSRTELCLVELDAQRHFCSVWQHPVRAAFLP